MLTFQDTTPNAADISRNVPTDLVMIDGKDIYDILPGYRQLKTEGRKLVPLSATTSNTYGQDGDNVDSTRLGSIDLTITYQLEARSDEELRDAIAILNSFLIADRQLRQLAFNDDKGFVYRRCLFTNSSTILEQGTTILGTFTFTSYDAYSRKTRQSDGDIALTYWKKVRPDRITVSFVSASENLVIENEKGQRIEFKNIAVPAGSSVIIEYTRDRIRAYNMVGNSERSVLYALTKYNALHAFFLYDGGNIAVYPINATVHVEWGDPKL